MGEGKNYPTLILTPKLNMLERKFLELQALGELYELIQMVGKGVVREVEDFINY